MKVEYCQILIAELKVNIYDGPKCDQHRKYWNMYAEGDKQDDDYEGDLTMTMEEFPPGTKIVVTTPQCPECFMIQTECKCGFNWKEWIEGKYS